MSSQLQPPASTARLPLSQVPVEAWADKMPELASRGADIVVSYSSSAPVADAVVESIEKLGSQAIAIQADISQTSAIANLFEQSLRTLQSYQYCRLKFRSRVIWPYFRNYSLGIRPRVQHQHKGPTFGCPAGIQVLDSR